MIGKTAIVLTGTIVPAVDFVAVSNTEQRRRQYLDTIHFYRRFAPVYFLENSEYDLIHDPDFRLDGVHLRKFTMLPGASRGKGYQEFAMLDCWHDTERDPPARILKITGRYGITNVAKFLQESCHAAPHLILIDRYTRTRVALTSHFSIGREMYAQTMYGHFREMDDAIGLWAERVFYRALKGRSDVYSFAHEPQLKGVSGSTGAALESPGWKWAARQVLRSLCRTAGIVELPLRG